MAKAPTLYIRRELILREINYHNQLNKVAMKELREGRRKVRELFSTLSTINKEIAKKKAGKKNGKL